MMLPVINTFITGSVSEQERGMVVSLYGAVRFGGVALGPVAFGVWKQDPTQMYIITFGFTLMNILLFALLAIRTKGGARTEIQKTFGKSPR
ncbi:hypothetical protein FHE72_15055 [Rossellomorea vietnamensis]|uniref:Uncharacterized protein n=1 Tax=Rossellomorea vietnamensis TaxID=218284 RepID=A0A6I6UQT1_9BACI|nr:hypothetical protein [Rossellomorea vietnamensis]QHE62189.1 hypothetical protein FHE72_15055 [Rossellomorea vietnamensis]